MRRARGVAPGPLRGRAVLGHRSASPFAMTGPTRTRFVGGFWRAAGGDMERAWSTLRRASMGAARCTRSGPTRGPPGAAASHLPDQSRFAPMDRAHVDVGSRPVRGKAVRDRPTLFIGPAPEKGNRLRRFRAHWSSGCSRILAPPPKRVDHQGIARRAPAGSEPRDPPTRSPASAATDVIP